MRRVRWLLLVSIAVLVASCTGSPRAPTRTRSPASVGSPSLPAAPSSNGRPIVLDVVAEMSPHIGASRWTNAYVDGMRLAADEVNRLGGVRGRLLQLAFHDDGGDLPRARRLLSSVLKGSPTALLFVGPGPAITPLRTQIEQSGTPTILLQGDLYTDRALFPQVFQTTIPWQWQAHVISRYVVRDRKAKDVVFVGAGPEAPVAMEALRSALQYWGGRLAAGFTDESRDPRSGQSMAFRRAARADWVVVFGSPLESSEIVNAIEEEAGIDRASHPSAPPGITASSALLVSNPALARPEPGTSACYPYTWAGWAEAIRRVARFRAAFQRYFGRPPGGLEQEGYDAVRTLASALERDRVRGGAALTSSLERVKSLTLSGFPIDLGPDDHLFLPRDELGLFAVAGPRERLDPWQSPGSEPWRPLMRTFTYDGRRDNILDQDKRVFFPRWRKDRPGPFYWRSRYGIVSRPGRDPLH